MPRQSHYDRKLAEWMDGWVDGMMRKLRNVAHWLGVYRVMDLLKRFWGDGQWDATTPLRPVSRVEHTLVVIVLLVLLALGLWLLAGLGHGG